MMPCALELSKIRFRPGVYRCLEFLRCLVRQCQSVISSFTIMSLIGPVPRSRHEGSRQLLRAFPNDVFAARTGFVAFFGLLLLGLNHIPHHSNHPNTTFPTLSLFKTNQFKKNKKNDYSHKILGVHRFH
ncbi:hypothetical protein L596_017029 [Steinernema carpocapsae]|uniref:Uncharacterized protein n=1 Tax=Steinernema carpocapsae TaxID=34508 RepID=A0A4U5N081_STECR|nr:hypothetical protein L596_017029 [Steinernema carpocapsae]